MEDTKRIWQYGSLNEMAADERPSHISEEEWANRIVDITTPLIPPVDAVARERMERWGKEQA